MDAAVPSSKLINFNDIEIRWVHDWYDGPISGACTVNGKLLWFQIVEYRESDDAYIYGLYDPPATIWATLHHRHGDFCTYVGDHNSYERGKRQPCPPHPRHKWDHYYRKWKRLSLQPNRPEWEIMRAEMVPQPPARIE
jgi:hypothetical protein